MARRSLLKLTVVMGLIMFLLGLTIGAKAQESTVGLTIGSVDAAAFPEITFYARAVDATRRPIAGLTANDFLILEDGVQVPSSNVKVESDTSRPLHLIFAIDTSVTPDTLIALQQAMKAVVASLGPQDQVAILAHSAQPNSVLGSFASNPAVLNTGIDALLVGQGNTTSLYETLSRAVSVARTVPSSQPAIILVTDGWDSQELFPGDATNQALAAEVPIYPITVGAGQSGVTTAEGMARETGGQAFILAGANEIAPNLQNLQTALRQAYRISYTSTVIPDGTEHGLTVSVNYQGTRALSTGEFTAVPTAIVVRLPGLSEGQSVSGIVPLTVQVVAPAPIVSVEYRVNDVFLIKQDRAPYNYEWDTSSLNPGLHTLAVRAIDETGNVGENRLSLNITSPLSVQATLSADRVEVGRDVTIEAEVETLTSVSQVEFLLDGRVLGSDDTAPYSFTFNSGKYQAASYSITVRAYDALGNTDEATLPIQILAAGSTRNWGAIGRWILLLLGLGALIAALLFFLKKRPKGGAVKHCHIEIQNTGNISSRYELRAETPDDALGFHFALAGQPLLQRQEVIETTVSVPTSGVSRSLPTPPTNEGGGGFGFLSGAADVVAEILTNLSYLVPGEAGSSMVRMAGWLRRGRRTAELAGRIVPGSKGGTSGVSQGAAQQRMTGTTNGYGNTQVVQTVGKTWTQTPPIQPGETLVVDLFIEALKASTTNTYSFQIISRSVEQEGAPTIIEPAHVQIVKPALFGR